MNTRRQRTRRSIQLEMLEIRTALSHLGLATSGAEHVHRHHDGHHDSPAAQISVMDRHDGQGPGNVNTNRGPGPNSGPGHNQGPGHDQNDAADNDLNDVADNDADDAADLQEHHGNGGRH
jgi:hypothetical protein